MQQVHPCLFCCSKGGFDIGRCQSYMVDCSGLFRRTMVFIGFDHQIAKLKKRNALPGGFVYRFQRRNKPQLLVKCNGLVEIICRDANVATPVRTCGKRIPSLPPQSSPLL